MFLENRGGLRFTPRVIIGICAIVLGVQWTLANLGWLDHAFLRFWPVVVVGIGLMMVLNPTAAGRTPGWVVLAVGCWLTTTVIYRLRIDLWDLWPIALVAMGIAMIRRGREHVLSGRDAAATGEPGGVSLNQTFSAVAVWSGIKRRVTSVAFRRADLVAVMGGIEVDLRQAGTAGGEAVIDVFAVWGGIEIVVPPDWDVVVEVVAIMGAAEDKTSGGQGPRHRLVLRGFVLMGGVEVKN
jgi:predicted membrane protein